jgi:hypothetical protein
MTLLSGIAPRLASLALLVAAGVIPLCAQDPESVNDAIRMAYSVPPELASDALLRIAESHVLRDTGKAVELISDAFQMASGAKFPYKLSLTGRGIQGGDSRITALTNTYQLGLDAFSLKCRAVIAMLPLDKAKARDLFGRIPPLRIGPYACKDVLLPDVAMYYTAALMIAQDGFSASEAAKGEPTRFVDSVLRAMTSIRQAEPAAFMIIALKPNADDLSVLATAYAGALGAIDISDRAFDIPFSLNERIGELAAMCVKAGVPADGLARAYRAVLARHFSDARCADNLAWGRSKEATDAEADPVARVFNSSKLRHAPFTSEDLPALSDEETTPRSVITELADAHAYWSTPETSALYRQLMRLWLDENDGPRPLEARKTSAWQSDVIDLIASMNAWQPDSSVNVSDYFNQKCYLYEPLIESLPPGSLREQLIAAYVGYLSRAAIQQESPAEWFRAARNLLKGVESSSAKEAAASSRQGQDVDAILAEFERSGSLVLSLYRKLEKLLPAQK